MVSSVSACPLFLCTRPAPETLALEQGPASGPLPMLFPLPLLSPTYPPTLLPGFLPLSVSAFLYKTFTWPCSVNPYPPSLLRAAPFLLSHVFTAQITARPFMCICVLCAHRLAAWGEWRLFCSRFFLNIELWMACGGGPINICCWMLPVLPYIPFSFRMQIYSLYYTRKPARASRLASCSQSTFSRGHKGAERREFTEPWDASDLFPWKLDIGFPEGRDLSFLFWEEGMQKQGPISL